jgi:hypothetical protein
MPQRRLPALTPFLDGVQLRRDLRMVASITHSGMVIGAGDGALHVLLEFGQQSGICTQHLFARFERRRSSRRKCDEAGFHASRLHPKKVPGALGA